MNKPKKGKAWWINPTSDGKFALIASETNTDIDHFEELEEKMIGNSDIKIYDTYGEAECIRFQLMENEKKILEFSDCL